jgi:arylsulfatase A-like enzyme
VGLTVCLALWAGCTAERRPPNVVLVVMDTVRPDRLSAYGYTRETTPNLDQLVTTSRVFYNAYSTSSWTSPAHASLFTGLYPVAHQTTQESWTLDPELTTLAEILSDNGYEAVAMVGNPMLSRERRFDQGFAHYSETWRFARARTRERPGQPPQLADDIAAELIGEFVERPEGSRPFFIFVNLIGPHSPYDSCRQYCASFVSDPSIKIRSNQWAAYYMGGRKFSDAEILHLGELYDAEIRHADEIVGRIIGSLRAGGHWDDSLFVVTSDHGENIGDHGHMDHVFSLYETTARIPLIVRYPVLFEPGSADHVPVQLPDLFTTTLRTAGVDPTRYSAHGVDLSDESARAERAVFLEYYKPVQALGLVKRWATPAQRRALARYDRRLRAVISSDRKLIWASDGRHELYDLGTDPEERNDLSHQPAHAADLGGLVKLLEGTVEEYAEPPREAIEQLPLSEETKRALEALGYLQ